MEKLDHLDSLAQLVNLDRRVLEVKMVYRDPRDHVDRRERVASQDLPEHQ